MQARGITMKSSAICLLHVPGATSLPGGAASCTEEDKRSKGKQLLLNRPSTSTHACICISRHCLFCQSCRAVATVPCTWCIRLGVQGISLRLRQQYQSSFVCFRIPHQSDRFSWACGFLQRGQHRCPTKRWSSGHSGCRGGGLHPDTCCAPAGLAREGASLQVHAPLTAAVTCRICSTSRRVCTGPDMNGSRAIQHIKFYV